MTQILIELDNSNLTDAFKQIVSNMKGAKIIKTIELVPNETTQKAITDARKGKGKTFKVPKDLFKEIGV